MKGNIGANGGAVYFNDDGYSTMTNVLMTGNYGTRGGALCHNNGYTICNFCTISGNSSFTSGGGIYILNAGAQPTQIRNSIVYNNYARLPTDPDYDQIETNHLWEQIEVQYSLINQPPGSAVDSITDTGYKDMGNDDTATYTAGTVFVDRREPSSVPTDEGDYHLQTGAPAIDAAIAAFPFGYDIDGQERPNPDTSIPDMGVDEYYPWSPFKTLRPQYITLSVCWVSGYSVFFSWTREFFQVIEWLCSQPK